MEEWKCVWIDGSGVLHGDINGNESVVTDAEVQAVQQGADVDVVPSWCMSLTARAHDAVVLVALGASSSHCGLGPCLGDAILIRADRWRPPLAVAVAAGVELKEPTSNKQNCEAVIYMPARASLMSSKGARRRQQHQEQQDLDMNEGVTGDPIEGGVEIQPVGQDWRSNPQWSRAVAVAPGWGPWATRIAAGIGPQGGADTRRTVPGDSGESIKVAVRDTRSG
jgi:hypothetical protein